LETPDALATLKKVLELEAEALLRASSRLDAPTAASLALIFERLIQLGGNLVFCGVGKSGFIARKLAATFSSLGRPSFFLHPVEALHGDLGLVQKNDALVLISKSGTTEEIVKLLPFLSVAKEMRIGLIGNSRSTLASEVAVNLDCSVEKEACLNNLAPTTSSTLALAMGDAMAVLYEQMVGLSKEGFAINHPGGLLGKSMLIKVGDLMIKPLACPQVSLGSSLKDAILAMTKFPVGGCAVIDDKKKLVGIIVEGDIRRSLAANDNALTLPISQVMNHKPTSIGVESLAFDALKLMEHREKPISLLPVLAPSGEFAGFIRLHDLLKEGFALS
jgi:arabinose-5-phosphate isomerase